MFVMYMILIQLLPINFDEWMVNEFVILIEFLLVIPVGLPFEYKRLSPLIT